MVSWRQQRHRTYVVQVSARAALLALCPAGLRPGCSIHPPTRPSGLAPVSSQPTAPSRCMAAAKASTATALLPCRMSRRLASAFQPSWACSLRVAEGGQHQARRLGSQVTFNPPAAPLCFICVTCRAHLCNTARSQPVAHLFAAWAAGGMASCCSWRCSVPRQYRQRYTAIAASSSSGRSRRNASCIPRASWLSPAYQSTAASSHMPAFAPAPALAPLLCLALLAALTCKPAVG